LDDIHWLFAGGGMNLFLELKEHMCQDLALKFLSTL